MSPRERDPIANDARKAARRYRFPGAACVLCGESDPDVLVAGRRVLIELHHVAGAANDAAAVVPLCRNCHAVATERQRDAGVDLTRREDRHLLERLEAALRSLGTFLALLAERCLAWADGVAAVVSGLDTAMPGWRVATQGAL